MGVEEMDVFNINDYDDDHHRLTSVTHHLVFWKRLFLPS